MHRSRSIRWLPCSRRPRRRGVGLFRSRSGILFRRVKSPFGDSADGGHTASLEFVATAYNLDRKRVTFTSQTVRLPLSDDAYRTFLEKPFIFSQQLKLPPVTLCVGVLDSGSQKVGKIEVPITVPGSSSLSAIPPVAAFAPCPPRCALPHPSPSTEAPR